MFGVSLAAHGAALLAEAYVLALWLVHGTTSSPTFRLLLQGLLVVELLLAGAFVGLYWPLVIRMVRRAPRAA